MAERDRDEAGRARNARPRDAAGRPLPKGAEGVERVPEDVALPPDEAVTEAQRLLDEGRPFHAHEVFEGVWKDPATTDRELWKGLAQLAVGLTHAQRGNATGAVSLLRRGADRLAGRDDTPHGLDLPGLSAAADALAGRIAEHGPDPVRPDELRLRGTTDYPGVWLPVPGYAPAMTSTAFVPVGFAAPTSLVTDRFRLEPLGPQHNEADHAAWTSSIEHIRATPGYPDGTWPPLDGMSLDANLADLRRHDADFTAGRGFTFTVLDPADGDVIGCVYLYPTASADHDVTVQSWVRADRAELDAPLADAVDAWLAAEWPWERRDRCGR